MLKIKPNKFVYPIMILVVFIVVYGPATFLDFSLIDDAFTVKLSRQLISYLSNFNFKESFFLLFESADGRVRPAYWLLQTIISSVSFYSSHIMHLFRLIQLLITMYLIYKITEALKVYRFATLSSIFLYLFNFQNFENYYRIGPAETLQVCFLAFVIYLLSQDKVTKIYSLFLMIVSNILASFTKEQYFVLFPSFLIGYIFSRKNYQNKGLRLLGKKMLFSFLTLVISGALILLIRSGYSISDTGYTHHYRFDLVTMVSNAKDLLTKLCYNQFPFFQLSLVHLAFFTYKKIKKFLFTKKDVIYIFLWTSAFVQYAVLLPWDFPIERYLIVVNFIMSLIYGLILSDYWNVLRSLFPELISKIYFKNNSVPAILLVGLLLTFIIRNLIPIANFQLWQKMDTSLSSEILNTLSREIPKNGKVFVNYNTGESNIEIYLSTFWSLEQFYNRNDISFIYLNEQNLCADEVRYILDRTSDRKFNSEILKRNDLEIIAFGNKTYNPLTYGDVKKSFINGYKTDNWRVERVYDWTLFKQIDGSCIQL